MPEVRIVQFAVERNSGFSTTSGCFWFSICDRVRGNWSFVNAINNEIRRRVYTLPYNGEVAFFASKAAIMTLKYSHLLFSFEIHTR